MQRGGVAVVTADESLQCCEPIFYAKSGEKILKIRAWEQMRRHGRKKKLKADLFVDALFYF